ncbi:hypothetical protein H2203_002643 [Taxawa tesnikishii (nom. ined.)]|nr:hypothetical protein H2203_002643 [Dothideales sp. JES 119]
MSAEKRLASNSFGAGQIVKRQRSNDDMGSNALTVADGAQNGALIQGRHTAPIPVMELSGHSGEVFCARFDPTGQHIASGSMDRDIYLWHSHGSCENYGILSGHKGAVLDLSWSRDSRVLYSASADMHLCSWDLETGTRIRRHVGHEEVINAMDKTAVDFIETQFPVTTVCISEAGNELYSGGIDNDIRVWDIRKRPSRTRLSATRIPSRASL